MESELVTVKNQMQSCLSLLFLEKKSGTSCCNDYWFDASSI